MTEREIRMGRAELRAGEEAYLNEAVARKRKASPWLWYLVAGVLFFGDRWMKALALALGEGSGGGAFQFALFKNGGIAFSLPLPDAIFWPAAFAVFVFLAVLFLRSPKRGASAVALSYVILGAASNLIDRALFGATIDYLIFFGWSAVNIADGMIVGGLLALLLLSHRT
jgi:lipoprotein signal peptidase